MLRLIRDSNSRPSWTLTLAVPAIVGITAWFICGGVDLTLPGGLHVLTATKSGSEYALAIAPWLTFVAQRGWRNKGGSTDGTGAAPGTPAR